MSEDGFCTAELLPTYTAPKYERGACPTCAITKEWDDADGCPDCSVAWAVEWALAEYKRLHPEDPAFWVCLDCGDQKNAEDMATEVPDMLTDDDAPGGAGASVGSCRECFADKQREWQDESTHG